MIRFIGSPCMTVEPVRTTNHSFRLSNLKEERLRQAIQANVADLEAILTWMAAYPRMRRFRIGSQFVPFASHERFIWDWISWLREPLKRIGERFLLLGFRFSLHPGQYTVLNSPNPVVFERALAEVRYSIRVLELLGAQPGEHVVVLHVGGVYGDKRRSLQLLSKRLRELPEAERHWIALENDERHYNLADVLAVCEETGVRPIWDAHHHRLNPAEPLGELLRRVGTLWQGAVPKIHLSSQRRDAPPGAHADFILPEDLDWVLEHLPMRVDLMLEAKAKERAALEVAEWLDRRHAWAPP